MDFLQELQFLAENTFAPKPEYHLGAPITDTGGVITETDLPMDLDSRMRRAQQLGFDTDHPLYHGTGGSFERFKREFHGSVMGAHAREPFAIWLTSSPEVAGAYATLATTDRELWDGTIRNGAGDPSIMPLLVRPAGFDVVDCAAMNHYALLRRKAWFLGEAKRRGAPGVIFKNAEDGSPQRSDVYAVFNPRRVRSIFAAFASRTATNLMA